MKVTGPDQPAAPDLSGPEGGNKLDKGAKTATIGGLAEPGKSFADKVSGARPPEAGVTTPSLRAGARVSDAGVSDLAADLKAGKLTPQAAIDKVLDRVVARQIGPEAPAAVREQVRAALQEALESDPLLVDKLRQLG